MESAPRFKIQDFIGICRIEQLIYPRVSTLKSTDNGGHVICRPADDLSYWPFHVWET